MKTRIIGLILLALGLGISYIVQQNNSAPTPSASSDQGIRIP